MDVDLDLDWLQDSTMEPQYPHIQASNFPRSENTLASAFDQHSSSMLPVSTRSAIFCPKQLHRPFAPSILDCLFNSPSQNALDPLGPSPAPKNSNTRQLRKIADTLTDPLTPASTNTIMRTPVSKAPARFQISPLVFEDVSITPFGKDFELADDWMVSGSYVSPVIHARKTKETPLRLQALSAISFVDRLQVPYPSAVLSPSGAIPLKHDKNKIIPTAPLLSPCRLTSNPSSKSSRKENDPDTQPMPHHPTDTFSISPLTSASPIFRLPISALKSPVFTTGIYLVTPRSLAGNLFPISPLTPLTPSPPVSPSSDSLTKPSAPPGPTRLRKRRRSPSESPTRGKRTRHN
ncbi:hypothetical protein B0H10DRAFT_869698 [Mycena sp. CBHHK59/15]|nr:hypothetical protein B0H10DRAFT_869698 [Mycena sp. CBHHK59/15]